MMKCYSQYLGNESTSYVIGTDFVSFSTPVKYVFLSPYDASSILALVVTEYVCKLLLE